MDLDVILEEGGRVVKTSACRQLRWLLSMTSVLSEVGEVVHQK